MPNISIVNQHSRIDGIIRLIEAQTKLNFERPAPNKWIMPLPEPIHFMLDKTHFVSARRITEDDPQASSLGVDKDYLKLNSQLNGIKIGFEGGYYTTNIERLLEEVTLKTVVDDIITHHVGGHTIVEQMEEIKKHYGL